MLTMYFSIVCFLLGIEIAQMLTGKMIGKIRLTIEVEPGDDGRHENLLEYDEVW